MQLISQSRIEADITYNETNEYKYLFNIAAFNETTMEWTVVSRVRMDKEGGNAYALGFNKTFEHCKKNNEGFDPSQSLVGVITDWSDAEINGLSSAVGNDVAKKLLKGCSVHWSRSWQRIRDRVAKSDDQSRERMLFSRIASQIQKLPVGSLVPVCFEVLCGLKSASVLVSKIKNFATEDAKFIDSHSDWSRANGWAKWWMRPGHLQMLHKDFSLMDVEAWERCPGDTNAVERKNRDSKESTPSPLRSALINLYKLDKSVCAKHLAASEGVSVSYQDGTPESRKRVAETRKWQRQKQQQAIRDKGALRGPPDKR